MESKKIKIFFVLWEGGSKIREGGIIYGRGVPKSGRGCFESNKLGRGVYCMVYSSHFLHKVVKQNHYFTFSVKTKLILTFLEGKL